VSNTKTICSVSAMAKSLGLSRARFYQLLKEGIFPQPVYDVRTRRPLYDSKLQELCRQIRQSGIGNNGQYVLFYSQRQNHNVKPAVKKKSVKINYTEITDALLQMDLKISENDIEKVLPELFPEGYENKEMGVIIRDLYRYFKK